MLFDKNIDPCCAYCRSGTDLGFNEVACVKYGLMTSSGFCKKFRYEPTKRVPHIGPRFESSGLLEEDVTL